MTGTFKLQVFFEGFNRTDNAFANIRKGVENTKGLFRTLGDQARSVFNLPNMIVGSALGTGLKSFFDAGAKLESTKISMKVLLKGDDNAVNKLMQEWKTLGEKTNLEDEDIFGVGKMMLGFNAATKENVSQFAGMLADLSGAADNPKQAFQSMGLAFSQVMSAGKLQGNDLLQFINAGFNPLQEMVKMIKKGVAVDGLKLTGNLQNKSEQEITAHLYKLKEAGKLSSKAVVSAMQYATGKDGLFYKMQDQLSETASGKFSTLVSNFKTSVSEASLKAMPVFKEWLDILIVKVRQFSTWISANKDRIKEWVSYIPSILKAVVVFKSITFSLAFAKGIYGSITAITKFVKVYRLMNLAMATGNIAQQTRLIGLFGDCAKGAGLAVKVKTALTWLWNRALMANPIIAIASGALLLCTALYGLSHSMSKAISQEELMNKVRKEARGQMIDEEVGLTLLYNKLRNTNPESKERLDIINELKQAYPDYIAKMNLEKASNEEIAKSYRDVVEAMEAKIEKELYEEEMKTAVREKIFSERKLKEYDENENTFSGSLLNGLSDIMAHPLGAITQQDARTDMVGYIQTQEEIIHNIQSNIQKLSKEKNDNPTKTGKVQIVQNNSFNGVTDKNMPYMLQSVEKNNKQLLDLRGWYDN